MDVRRVRGGAGREIVVVACDIVGGETEEAERAQGAL